MATIPGPGLLHALLDEAAARDPEGMAVRDSGGAWTYSRLVEEGHRAATWLLRRGVGRGDRVLVRLPGSRELAALLYGASRIGAAFSPVSPKLRPFQLRGVLREADPALVLAADQDAAAVRGLTDRPVVAAGTAWDELRDAPATSPAARPDEADMALLLFTSGSTSTPKGVVCPHAAVVFAARAVAARLRYRPDDVVLSWLPVAFDYGLYQFLLAAVGGAELVLAGETPGAGMLAELRTTGATVVPVLPPLATMLLALAARDPGSVPETVRLFTNTGAALAPSAIEALRRRFPGAQVTLMFGLTECKRVSIMEPDGDLERPGSVGRALDGTEVQILDEHGRRLPPGEVGEIVVSGPHVMAGYWRAPELTARRFRRSPGTGRVLLRTGDYGHLDQSGYLYFQGRRDDLYKSRGVRTSAVEVEAAAVDVTGVRQASVLPPRDGRGAVLFVVGDRTAGEVLRELALRLETAKVPSACQVVESLPLTPNGKPDRARLALQAGSPSR